MQKIEAIIRPEKLEPVKDALEASGFSSLTVTDVQGRGRQRGIQLEWRVGTYNVEFLPKTKIEIVCDESDCRTIIEIICEAAATGEVGDGKIFLSEVKEVIRIRTNERGAGAL